MLSYLAVGESECRHFLVHSVSSAHTAHQRHHVVAAGGAAVAVDAVRHMPTRIRVLNSAIKLITVLCHDSKTSVFPTEHFLRTRTQVRHECTQVHNEKRSSKLAKSMSVPFGADKPLICHSEKR